MECPEIRQITEKFGWFRAPSQSEYDLATVKRCASALGEGAMAVTFVHRYLANS